MTDAIAGFPGEEEEDFAATLELLRRAAPAAVNRSRFSPRPGTAAALMKPVPSSIIGERAARLNDLAAAWRARIIAGLWGAALACWWPRLRAPARWWRTTAPGARWTCKGSGRWASGSM